MTIVDNSTQQEKISPFYKVLKKQIGQWQDFANSNNGILNGSFNVYETDLEIDFSQSNLKVNGWKQQYSVGTDSWFAKQSNQSERTEFIKRVESESSKFRIFKPSWIQKIYFLFTSKYSRVDKEFFILFENENEYIRFIEFFRSIQKAAPSFRIHEFKLKENEIRLTYRSFISEKSDLLKIFEVLNDVSL